MFVLIAPNVTEILKLIWGPKNKVFYFPLNLGSVRCASMRGFQIWSQNWNRLTSDPFLAKKNCQKPTKYLILPVFDSFFAKKRIKCYPISILSPDSEASHEGASNWPRIDRKIENFIFDSHSNFRISIALRAIKTNIFVKTNYTTLINKKKRTRIGGKREEIKNVEKWRTLMGMGVGYWNWIWSARTW